MSQDVQITKPTGKMSCHLSKQSIHDKLREEMSGLMHAGLKMWSLLDCQKAIGGMDLLTSDDTQGACLPLRTLNIYCVFRLK